LSEITELKYTSLIKIVILEGNFKWHLEAFASELFIFWMWLPSCRSSLDWPGPALLSSEIACWPGRQHFKVYNFS